MVRAGAVPRTIGAMTWPAPTTPPSRPPAPPPGRGDDRRTTARPVAAWLAATGGSLVLVAAIVAVAGNWQDIAAWIKLAGLLTLATTVIVGAERARSSLPATARSMAHLGAALVAPVGIAASAMAGQRWPVCVLVGGVLAAVACDVQARRWRAPLLDVATITAIGLALTGVAALVPIPVGVLGAVAGCALAARPPRHCRGHVRHGRRGDSGARGAGRATGRSRDARPDRRHG